MAEEPKNFLVEKGFLTQEQANNIKDEKELQNIVQKNLFEKMAEEPKNFFVEKDLLTQEESNNIKDEKELQNIVQKKLEEKIKPVAKKILTDLGLSNTANLLDNSSMEKLLNEPITDNGLFYGTKISDLLEFFNN